MSDMKYRQLGASGLAVSEVGLGCNNFGRRIDRDAVQAVVDAALDAGITLFDTADTYRSPTADSEELLGAALKGRRDQAVIATKFGSDMHGANGPDWDVRGSRRYIRIAVEASLRRLDTDWIDLYQIHRPDPRTPIEETLDALNDLVHEGKVRYIGSSNYPAWQVADADWTARSRGLCRFVSAQNDYNLLRRQAEDELLPACEHLGIGFLPYFPLASGLLTGKYREGRPPPEGTRLAAMSGTLETAPWKTVEALIAHVAEAGRPLVELAVGWLLAKPVVSSVIAGATRPEQVWANVAAADTPLTPDEVAALDALTIAGEG